MQMLIPNWKLWYVNQECNQNGPVACPGSYAVGTQGCIAGSETHTGYEADVSIQLLKLQNDITPPLPLYSQRSA
jgi:hypothetical protein